MNNEELIFNLINDISYPFLLLKEENNFTYKQSYSNRMMQEVLISANMYEENIKEGDLLFELLQEYKDNETQEYVCHDIEIFHSIYTLNFNKTDQGILIIFIKTKMEILNAITFNEVNGLCNAIIVILDLNGKIIDMNECFLNFIAMKKEDVLSKSFLKTFIPGDINILNKYFKNILSKDDYHQHFVTPLKSADNKIYKINWQVSKIVKQNKDYIVAVGSDVSKFLDENSDLKRQLTSIKVGFDYFPFSIGYMNSKGRFIKMNSRFMKMFRIAELTSETTFDSIEILHKNIGFNTMKENIGFLNEISYNIGTDFSHQFMKIKVDIRMLSGKKESSKFYIVVVQKSTS